MDLKIKDCDVLIIGGGGSGALAALEASKDERLRVMLVSKGPIGMSGLTPTANGGIAGAGPEEDTSHLMITTGRFLNDQDIAWFMTHEIKNALESLKALGVPVVPVRGRSVAVQSTETLRKDSAPTSSTNRNIDLREGPARDAPFHLGRCRLGRNRARSCDRGISLS